MDTPLYSSGDIARAALNAIVALIRSMDTAPGWLSDLLRMMIRAFKRVVRSTGRLFASSYTAAIVSSSSGRPSSSADASGRTVVEKALSVETATSPVVFSVLVPSVAVKVAPATPVSPAAPAETATARVAVEATPRLSAVEKSAVVPAAPVLAPVQTTAAATTVAARTVFKAVVFAVAVSVAASTVGTTAAQVSVASSVGKPVLVVDILTPYVVVAFSLPLCAAKESLALTSTAMPLAPVLLPTQSSSVASAVIVPAAAAPTPGFPAPVPKYVAFVNTGEFKQTRELSIDDYTSLLTEGMSIPGHVVKSVHARAPDFAHVVYDTMKDLEAVVKVFAGRPPVDGPLAGVEMKVSAPVPGPYPTPAPPAGPKFTVYAHTDGLLKKGEMSLSDYMSLLKEGMSIPGHAVKFVRVRVPDLTHVMYETKEDAQAVVDAFADGPPVGGPLDGIEMWVEMRTRHRGSRGRGGRCGKQSAAGA